MKIRKIIKEKMDDSLNWIRDVEPEDPRHPYIGMKWVVVNDSGEHVYEIIDLNDEQMYLEWRNIDGDYVEAKYHLELYFRLVDDDRVKIINNNLNESEDPLQWMKDINPTPELKIGSCFIDVMDSTQTKWYIKRFRQTLGGTPVIEVINDLTETKNLHRESFEENLHQGRYKPCNKLMESEDPLQWIKDVEPAKTLRDVGEEDRFMVTKIKGVTRYYLRKEYATNENIGLDDYMGHIFRIDSEIDTDSYESLYGLEEAEARKFGIDLQDMADNIQITPTNINDRNWDYIFYLAVDDVEVVILNDPKKEITESDDLEWIRDVEPGVNLEPETVYFFSPNLTLEEMPTFVNRIKDNPYIKKRLLKLLNDGHSLWYDQVKKKGFKYFVTSEDADSMWEGWCNETTLEEVKLSYPYHNIIMGREEFGMDSLNESDKDNPLQWIKDVKTNKWDEVEFKVADNKYLTTTYKIIDWGDPKGVRVVWRMDDDYRNKWKHAHYTREEVEKYIDDGTWVIVNNPITESEDPLQWVKNIIDLPFDQLKEGDTFIYMSKPNNGGEMFCTVTGFKCSPCTRYERKEGQKTHVIVKTNKNGEKERKMIINRWWYEKSRKEGNIREFKPKLNESDEDNPLQWIKDENPTPHVDQLKEGDDFTFVHPDGTNITCVVEEVSDAIIIVKTYGHPTRRDGFPMIINKKAYERRRKEGLVY